MLALSLVYSCYCYSEIVNGITPNPTNGLTSWSMNGVLPSQSSLTVDSVIYRYTTVKNQTDNLIVSVQNENAINGGYLFQKKDNWSGLSGNTITNSIAVPNISINYWGNGSITKSGIGEVKDTVVLYKYRYDTCANEPVTDTSCPNYVNPRKNVQTIETYDVLSDELIKNSINQKLFEDKEEKEKQNKLSLEKDKPKQDKVIDNKKIVHNILLTRDDQIKSSQFEMLNNIPGLAAYSVQIPGGAYNETIRYVDKGLPDNRNGRRLGLSQERLHTEMVDSQYNNINQEKQ